MNLLKLMGILLLAILISPDTFSHCKGKHADNPGYPECETHDHDSSLRN